MSINPRTSGGNTLYPEGIVANQQVATWSQYQASSDVNLAGNTIQNVNLIEVNDISGLDSADIVPLIENATITNLSITNLTSVNSGAIADLVSFDVLVENDLSVNGVLRSHQLDTLSSRIDTLSGYVDGLTSGATSLADAIALDNDASDLSIVNLGSLLINKSSAVGRELEINGKALVRDGIGIGNGTLPPGSEKFEISYDISQNVYTRWKHFGFTYGYFTGIQTLASNGARHELLDPYDIHFITTPNTPGNRYITLSVKADRKIALPGYTAGTLSVDATGVVQSSSDRRAKKNIVYADDLHGLEIVNGLKPARYTFNNERDTDRHLGFIADDVLLVCPDAVDGKKYPYVFAYDISGDGIHDQEKIIKLNPDGTPMMDTTTPRMKGLDTTALISVLVKAVQELSIKVDKLTKLVI